MSDHDPHGEPTRVDTPVTDPTMAMPAATGGQPPVGPPPTDEPPAEPPDRRPWIIGGILLLIVLVGLAILLLGDDDETASDDTTTTTTESTTTTTEPTTTTTAPTTTTTAPTTTTTSPPSTVAPGLCVSSAPDDPDTTAQVVYQAYTLGDRDCAGNLATATAIDQLFAIPGGGGGWTFQGCFDEEEPDPHTLCGFSFEGGSTSFRMNYSEVEGWTVYQVFQTAD
jgi:serine/threonine-protein kinase